MADRPGNRLFVCHDGMTAVDGSGGSPRGVRPGANARRRHHSGEGTWRDWTVLSRPRLTSELVTNAVVHAGTPVEVTCKLAGGGVEVVVSDSHPVSLVPEPPEHEHVPAERTSGYGLLLPAALASAWGVTYGQSAKAVWFRIGQAESAPEPGPGQGGQRGDGLRAALDTGFHAVPDRGPDGQAKLVAALRQAPVAPV